MSSTSEPFIGTVRSVGATCKTHQPLYRSSEIYIYREKLGSPTNAKVIFDHRCDGVSEELPLKDKEGPWTSRACETYAVVDSARSRIALYLRSGNSPSACEKYRSSYSRTSRTSSLSETEELAARGIKGRLGLTSRCDIQENAETHVNYYPTLHISNAVVIRHRPTYSNTR